MKFKLSKSSDGQFWFVITARNGQTLLTSETYKRKAGAMGTIRVLNNAFKNPLPIEDFTRKK